jgi:aldehyde:ferredoxin oxidoreductase
LYHEAKGIKLQINLPQKIVKESIDPPLAKMFLGGLDFNAKILYDEVGPVLIHLVLITLLPRVDPLGPDNIVVIGLFYVFHLVDPRNESTSLLNASGFSILDI